MVNRDIGRLEPSQTLKYKYAAYENTLHSYHISVN
jgi:hypothetical protein